MDHLLGGQLFIDDQRADRRYVGFLHGLLRTGTLKFDAAEIRVRVQPVERERARNPSLAVQPEVL